MGGRALKLVPFFLVYSTIVGHDTRCVHEHFTASTDGLPPEHQPRLGVRSPCLLLRPFRVGDGGVGAEFRWPVLRQEYSLKWTIRCPMAVSQPGRDLAWSSLGNDISLSTWRRLLLFSRLSAGHKPDSAITTSRLVVRKFPVIALPSWFSFWSSSHRFFTPAPFRSSYHSSAPYSADACTHATSASLRRPGTSLVPSVAECSASPCGPSSSPRSGAL